MKFTEKPISIKHWSDEDKPREKFLLKGPLSLTNAELLAIIIGTGDRKETAVDLAKRILKASNNRLNKLGSTTVTNLMEFNGIGTSKAVRIAASLEIGRRRKYEKNTSITKITKSEDVFHFLRPFLADLLHEEFWIVYLNNANQIVHKAQLSIGGITGTLVDTRLVMKQAVLCNAVALILSHNHPSGNEKPSEADKNITSKMCLAAKTLDIKVLDHVIITKDKYFSFADNNII